MTYIPKNKIQTNLYTSGGEFTYLNNSLNYVGFYHKLYNGKYFTGETPNTPNKKEITPISSTIDNEIESNVNPIPTYNPILPTEQDYNLGEFTRYFSVKRNQLIFSEINKNIYNDFKSRNPQVSWKLYKVFSLPWKLTGDINQVSYTNKNITSLTESRENVLGLGLYLKENWIQYYKKI
jgi:hypothetical protein